MDEKKIFHPREVVNGLGLGVPERGGRRTINMDVGISRRIRQCIRAVSNGLVMLLTVPRSVAQLL